MSCGDDSCLRTMSEETNERTNKQTSKQNAGEQDLNLDFLRGNVRRAVLSV
jgi:hypothetical protein